MLNNFKIKTPKMYRTIAKDYPKLTKLLINDLLAIEGYSEIEIGFAANIQLDLIRKISLGKCQYVPPSIFYKILGLYTKVFCNWFKLGNEI